MAYSLMLLVVPAVTFLCYISYERLFKKIQIPDGAKSLPGPKGYPVIGSVPDLDPKYPWMKMVDWSKDYGTMFQVNLNGQNTVWITSHKICEDLFVKRGAIYSDRPFIPAIGEDCRFTNRYVPLVTYGEDMKRIKNWIKTTMSSMPPDRLKGLSQKGAATFVTRLIAEPHLFKQFCEECTSQISGQMAWNDSRLSTARETIMRANQLLRRISPDGDIQNKLPFLRKFPDWIPDFLQPWRVEERVRFFRERNFWFGQKEAVRKSLHSEKSTMSSWMSRHLTMPTTPKLDEDNTYSVGMLALIGSILTSSPIQSFFLAMIVSPEWQCKGQEEVDRVCGDRPPCFDDIQNLPVVRAIISEIFRWRSPAPAGVPHVLKQDDVYEGYFLPKDTVCFALEWGLCRDPILYPDPENFRPERWLSPEFPTYREPLTHWPSIKAQHGFGWGRRACIGQDHVEMVLFTIIATILWSVDIRKKKNEKGEDIEVPWFDYTAYVIVRPEWFAFDVVERRGEGADALDRAVLLRDRADMEMVSGEDGVVNGKAVGYEKREVW